MSDMIGFGVAAHRGALADETASSGRVLRPDARPTPTRYPTLPELKTAPSTTRLGITVRRERHGGLGIVMGL